MQFKYQGEDGEIELLSLNRIQDVETLEKGTPRLGSTCSFKIFQISEFSAGEDATNSLPLAKSKYLLSVVSESANNNAISATIGVTSISEADRLIELCLTRLHVGETGRFAVVCARSKSSFILTVELVSIDESLEVFQLEKSRALEIVKILKEEGASLFKDGFIVDSFFKFSQAFKILTLIPDHDSVQDLICILQNNMANCHLKAGNWEEAIDLCDSVLQIDENNLKGLYRRGLSFTQIQEYEKAHQDLQKAKKLDPDNQAIKNQITVLDQKKKALDAKYAQAMKKFLA